jgi:hypothetical protein
MPRRPGMMRDMGPGNMPRRPDISDIFGRGSFLFGRRPRGNMGSDFRMPQIGGILREGKKRRFGFGLGEAIRRLKKQRDMGMPRRPSTPGMGFLGGTPGFYDRMIGTPQPIPERMPINRFKDPIKRPERMSSVDDGKMYAGGSPGLYKPGGRFYNPEARLQMPTSLPRTAEIDISALEPLPMGDMPMTQDLPEVAPVGMMGGRTLQQDFPTQPRMMMAGGDEAVTGLMAAGSTGSDTYIEQQSPDMLALVEMARNAETPEEVQEIFKLMDQLREMEGRPQLAGGGEAFPDLSGDGETTFKDVLIGRGVDLKAEGGEMMTQENEIDAMLGGMDSEEAGAMEDLEQMAPEMEMIDQLVTMVVQMIQQGASEEEVMMFLREQGLDDEDIGTVLQLVAEMAESEAMSQDGIDAELEQLA